MTTEDTDSTPSQRLLDAQTQQGDIQKVGQYQGRLDMAKGLIIAEVQEGGSAAEGRELLGDIDQLAEFPTAGDEGTADALYQRVRKFIKGQGPAASQGTAPSGQAPAPSQASKDASLNKKRAAYVRGEINEYPG